MRRTTGETGGAWPLPGSMFSAGAGDSVDPPPAIPAPASEPSASPGGCSSAWAWPGFEPVSIFASTTPTSTVTPTSTRISVTRPAAGDGISVSILSVEISTIVSSRSTQSPGRFFQSAIVPSATDTPIWGIVTSTTVVSVGEELTSRLLHVVDLRQDRAFEWRRERDRHVGRRHAADGTVEVLPSVLADDRCDLRHDAGRARRLLHQQDLGRLARRREDRLAVERHQRAQVEHLDRRAVDVLGRLERGPDHRAVGDHG